MMCFKVSPKNEWQFNQDIKVFKIHSYVRQIALILSFKTFFLSWFVCWMTACISCQIYLTEHRGIMSNYPVPSDIISKIHRAVGVLNNGIL